MIVTELSEATSEISYKLKNWSGAENPALKIFAKVRGYLENLESKLPTKEQKQVNYFLKKLNPKKYYFFKSNFSKITKDESWNLYADLCTIVVRLEELDKDSKWS